MVFVFVRIGIEVCAYYEARFTREIKISQRGEINPNFVKIHFIALHSTESRRIVPIFVFRNSLQTHVRIENLAIENLDKWNPRKNGKNRGAMASDIKNRRYSHVGKFNTYF